MAVVAVIILVAIVGGLAIAVQAQLTGLMSLEVGTLGTVFLTYGVGGLVAAALVALLRGGHVDGVRHLPPYVHLAGVFGLVIIATISYSVARLGVVRGLLLITVAQFIASALIDYFGWLGAPTQPLTSAKALGIALLLGGGWLVLR